MHFRENTSQTSPKRRLHLTRRGYTVLITGGLLLLCGIIKSCSNSDRPKEFNPDYWFPETELDTPGAYFPKGYELKTERTYKK